MITFSPATVEDYTRRGVWGTTTVDDLFRSAVIGGGCSLAIVDAPDKQAHTGLQALRLTWHELDVAVNRLCSRLMLAGLTKDDIVAVQLPNCVEFAVVYLAAARLGLIVCPLAIQYREHELRDLLGFVRPSAFVTLGRYKGHGHAAMIAGLRAQLPSIGAVLAWGVEGLEGVDSLDTLAQDPLDRAAVLQRQREANVDANEVFTITWTSGTEARPKGVPRTHNHWVCAGMACAEAGELQHGQPLLNPFPMAHVGSLGGMFMPWLIKRGTLVQHLPFELHTFLQQLQDERVAYTVAPPAVLDLLEQSEPLTRQYDLSALRSVGSGSAPLSPRMIRGLQERHGIAVWNSFGSSEGCGLFGSARDVPDPQDRSCLLPRFGVPGLEWNTWAAKIQETRLVDPQTEREITEAGQAGELRIRGPLVFSGYWQAEEASRQAFDAQGYFRTGDVFELAGAGPVPRYYRYVSRHKDVINRGGMKISPTELEALIESHPAVRETAVIGVPHERLGEVVCAVVVPLTDRDPPGLEDIVQHLQAAQIAVYKLPQRLEIVDTLPRNPVGKVLKRALRERYGEPGC